MTQVQYVSGKEMMRRTGFMALGYAKPKEKLILIRKGLPKKLERKVKAHEADHIQKGEEGPFLSAAGASIAGSLVSGLFGSSGADDAAEEAAQASIQAAEIMAEVQREAITEQRRKFNLIYSDLGPARGVGLNALYAMSDMTGLPGYTGNKEQFTDFTYGPQHASPGEAIEGEYIPAQAASEPNTRTIGRFHFGGEGANSWAYDPESNVTLRGLPGNRNSQRQIFQALNGATPSNNFDDWYLHGNGTSTENLINAARGPGDSVEGHFPGQDVYASFGAPQEYVSATQTTAAPAQRATRTSGASEERTPYDFKASPGYKFRLGEGLKGVTNYLNAKRMSRGGRAMKAIQRFGEGMAADEYERGYNRLGALLGTGTTATTQGASAASNTANSISSILQNTGSSQANAVANAGYYRGQGALGSASAWNSALQGGMQNILLSQLMRN